MGIGEQNEIRPIPGFPSYGACADGAIWRVVKKNPRILKGYQDKDGYIIHHLSEAGKSRMMRAHHLVALTFIGPKPDGMQMAHNDGNCVNNAAANLRWASSQENHDDKLRHGTTAKGEKNHVSILTQADVEWIRAYPKRHGMFAQMARRLQMTITAVHSAYHGDTWAHVPNAGGVA